MTPRDRPAEVRRPEQPDRHVLSSAGERLRGLLGWPDGIEVSWKVGRRIDRPRSTLFPIRASAPDGDIGAFYKVAHSPIGEGPRARWERRVRDGLSRAEELEPKLAAAIGGEPISFSRHLFADPRSMTSVTLAVSGRPMGRLPGAALTARSRRKVLSRLVTVGRSVALIESCSPEGLPVDDSVFEEAVERRVARLEGLISGPELASIASTMSSLDSEALRGPSSLVYAHGDFSSSNVLLTEEGIGLIDFTWPVRLRGYDLGHYAFRLEYGSLVPRPWAAQMVAALLEGYGDPNLFDSAAWQAIRLPRLLKLVEAGLRSGPGPSQRAAHRALAEVRSVVARA